MLVLGIESSCDETAAAIVKDGKTILSNIIYSQDDLHRKFGGVVPELASRRHVDVLILVIKEALDQAGLTLDAIDLIAVAKGPGLVGALLIGLNGAKALSLAREIPIIGVNHIEAHLYAALIDNEGPPPFPCLGAVFSGGHTTLVLMEGPGAYSLISQTTDDAVGEAFDKTARVLGLPYPGGPHIEALALHGNPDRFPFRPGKVKNNELAFSFSGLKTAVLYAARGQNGKINEKKFLTDEEKRDIAASFQKAAFDDVIAKTLKAAAMYNVETILFGGGVTNSRTLRRRFFEEGGKYQLLFPSGSLSLDNGAMIASLGTYKWLAGHRDTMELDVDSSLVFW